MRHPLHYSESPRRIRRRLAAVCVDGPLAKYLAALAIFTCSRVLVGLGVYLGSYFRPAPIEGAWRLGSAWLDPFMRFDAGWYLSILRDGYRAVPVGGAPSNLAFFPLFPLLASIVRLLAGCSDAAAMLAVANVAALVSALLLVRLGTLKFGERHAVYAVAVFSFFPTSFFLDAGYSELTCIAFVLGSLLALEERRFLAAALLAGAATAARSPALAMAPVVAYGVYADARTPKAALYGAIACGGLLAFIAYQAWAFGDPLGFVAAQRAWGNETVLVHVLRGVTLAAVLPIRPALAWLLLPLLLMVLNRHYIGRDLLLYGVASLLIPYLSVGVTPSAPRFALMCVPLWFCIARILRPAPLLAAVYFSFSAALLVMNTAKFSQWWFVA